MSISRKLDKASIAFYVTGFAVDKLRHLPLPLTSVFFLVSRFFYLISSLMWLISSHFYPDQTTLPKKWYAFLPYKKQHLIAAVISLLSITFGILGLVSPVFFVVAAWLCFLDAIIWCTGEYHRLKNPFPNDSPKQPNYFLYVFLTVIIGLVLGVAATLTFVFPAATTAILIASTIVNFGIFTYAAENWLKYVCSPPEVIIPKINSTYTKIVSRVASQAPTAQLNPPPIIKPAAENELQEKTEYRQVDKDLSTGSRKECASSSIGATTEEPNTKSIWVSIGPDGEEKDYTPKLKP